MEPVLIVALGILTLIGQLNNYGIDAEKNPHLKDVRVRRNIESQSYALRNKEVKGTETTEDIYSFKSTLQNDKVIKKRETILPQNDFDPDTSFVERRSDQLANKFAKKLEKDAHKLEKSATRYAETFERDITNTANKFANSLSDFVINVDPNKFNGFQKKTFRIKGTKETNIYKNRYGPNVYDTVVHKVQPPRDKSVITKTSPELNITIISNLPADTEFVDKTDNREKKIDNGEVTQRNGFNNNREYVNNHNNKHDPEHKSIDGNENTHGSSEDNFISHINGTQNDNQVNGKTFGDKNRHDSRHSNNEASQVNKQENLFNNAGKSSFGNTQDRTNHSNEDHDNKHIHSDKNDHLNTNNNANRQSTQTHTSRKSSSDVTIDGGYSSIASNSKNINKNSDKLNTNSQQVNSSVESSADSYDTSIVTNQRKNTYYTTNNYRYNTNKQTTAKPYPKLYETSMETYYRRTYTDPVSARSTNKFDNQRNFKTNINTSDDFNSNRQKENQTDEPYPKKDDKIIDSNQRRLYQETTTHINNLNNQRNFETDTYPADNFSNSQNEHPTVKPYPKKCETSNIETNQRRPYTYPATTRPISNYNNRQIFGNTFNQLLNSVIRTVESSNNGLYMNKKMNGNTRQTVYHPNYNQHKGSAYTRNGNSGYGSIFNHDATRFGIETLNNGFGSPNSANNIFSRTVLGRGTLRNNRGTTSNQHGTLRNAQSSSGAWQPSYSRSYPYPYEPYTNTGYDYAIPDTAPTQSILVAEYHDRKKRSYRSDDYNRLTQGRQPVIDSTRPIQQDKHLGVYYQEPYGRNSNNYDAVFEANTKRGYLRQNRTDNKYLDVYYQRPYGWNNNSYDEVFEANTKRGYLRQNQTNNKYLGVYYQRPYGWNNNSYDGDVESYKNKKKKTDYVVRYPAGPYDTSSHGYSWVNSLNNGANNPHYRPSVYINSPTGYTIYTHRNGSNITHSDSDIPKARRNDDVVTVSSVYNNYRSQYNRNDSNVDHLNPNNTKVNNYNNPNYTSINDHNSTVNLFYPNYSRGRSFNSNYNFPSNHTPSYGSVNLYNSSYTNVNYFKPHNTIVNHYYPNYTNVNNYNSNFTSINGHNINASYYNPNYTRTDFLNSNYPVFNNYTPNYSSVNLYNSNYTNVNYYNPNYTNVNLYSSNVNNNTPKYSSVNLYNSSYTNVNYYNPNYTNVNFYSSNVNNYTPSYSSVNFYNSNYPEVKDDNFQLPQPNNTLGNGNTANSYNVHVNYYYNPNYTNVNYFKLNVTNVKTFEDTSTNLNVNVNNTSVHYYSPYNYNVTLSNSTLVSQNATENSATSTTENIFEARIIGGFHCPGFLQAITIMGKKLCVAPKK